MLRAGILLGSATLALSSLGDSYTPFQICLQDCQADCKGRKASSQPLYLRAMGWDCVEECKYQCMMFQEAAHAEVGQEPLQYYGKWAFIRVAGVQEIASVLFSVMNFIPHAYFFWFRGDDIFPKGYVFSPFIRFFNLIGMMCWTSSTLFHLRDLWWTEFLDYALANILLGSSTVLGLARIFTIERPLHLATLATVGTTLFIAHVGYMLHHLFSTGRFPYGYNMTVALTMGISHAAMWVVYGLTTSRPYGWKASVAAGTVILASVLEVFDFPPVFGLVDAHALWHLSTCPLSLIFYDYLLDDLRDDMKLRRRLSAARRDPVAPSTADLRGKRA